MIKKRYHSRIAMFLLGCMFMLAMPFHDFLHQHSHVSVSTQKIDKSHDLVQKADKTISVHDCIACSISQLAHTFFVQSDNISVLLVAFANSFTERDVAQSNWSVIALSGRAPPAFL